MSESPPVLLFLLSGVPQHPALPAPLFDELNFPALPALLSDVPLLLFVGLNLLFAVLAHHDYSGLAVDVLPLPAVVQLLAALVGLFGVAPLPFVEQACLVLLSVALIPAFGVLIA